MSLQNLQPTYLVGSRFVGESEHQKRIFSDQAAKELLHHRIKLAAASVFASMVLTVGAVGSFVSWQIVHFTTMFMSETKSTPINNDWISLVFIGSTFAATVLTVIHAPLYVSRALNYQDYSSEKAIRKFDRLIDEFDPKNGRTLTLTLLSELQKRLILSSKDYHLISNVILADKNKWEKEYDKAWNQWLQRKGKLNQRILK